MPSDIQTEPNYTLFAVLDSNRPNLKNIERALIAIEDFAEEDALLATRILADRGIPSKMHCLRLSGLYSHTYERVSGLHKWLIRLPNPKALREAEP